MDTLATRLRRNPFALYGVMRTVAPVFRVPGRTIWMLFDFESVKRGLHDPEVFSSRAAPPGDAPLDWLIFLDPPQHTKLRALVMRTFTPRAVASLEPRIEALAHELLEGPLARGAIDLVRDFAARLPLLVIGELLGLPATDCDRMTTWSDAILHLGDAIAGGERAARAVAAYRAAKAEMQPYVQRLVAERRVAPRDDLLSRLAHASVDDERLTDQEIFDFFQLLLLAGSETTTNLIANAMLCLVAHPEQLATLRSNRAMLPSAVEEVLRFRSPLQMVFRSTTRDVKLGRRVIPARNLVLLMVGSANRDPRQFRDAARFDIGRAPNPHIAFGHGLHFCVGAALARLEAKVALTILLDRMSDVRIAGPWAPNTALNVHGPTSLPIRFTPAR